MQNASAAFLIVLISKLRLSHVLAEAQAAGISKSSQA